MEDQKLQVPIGTIIARIYEVRGKKVMLDKDLAALYEVTTGNLNKAVARNIQRFPDDFMFELTQEEWEWLKPEIEQSDWGGTRRLPRVFTEQGVAMLSGVLNSDRAIKMNIQIMRAYSKVREMLLTHRDILLKMEEIERRMNQQDDQVGRVFEYLRKFVEEKNRPRPRIGFRSDEVT